jgi:hypothetical protein
VPVSLLRARATGAALATNLLVSAVMMSTLVVGPFFVSLGLGLSAALVGRVMAVGPVTAALAGIRPDVRPTGSERRACWRPAWPK